jgi:hypothetical protein
MMLTSPSGSVLLSRSAAGFPGSWHVTRLRRLGTRRPFGHLQAPRGRLQRFVKDGLELGEKALHTTDW